MTKIKTILSETRTTNLPIKITRKPKIDIIHYSSLCSNGKDQTKTMTVAMFVGAVKIKQQRRTTLAFSRAIEVAISNIDIKTENKMNQHNTKYR